MLKSFIGKCIRLPIVALIIMCYYLYTLIWDYKELAPMFKSDRDNIRQEGWLVFLGLAASDYKFTADDAVTDYIDSIDHRLDAIDLRLSDNELTEEEAKDLALMHFKLFELKG